MTRRPSSSPRLPVHLTLTFALTATCLAHAQSWDPRLYDLRNVHRKRAETVNRLLNMGHDGDWRRAERDARRELERAVSEHGADSVQATDLRLVLVETGLRTGDPLDPVLLASARRVLDWHEQRHEARDWRLARPLTLLAEVLTSRGEHREALELHERALSIRKTSFGSGHFDVGHSLLRIGQTQRSLGDHAAARDAFERALRVRARTHGPNSFMTAGPMMELGNIYAEMGDYAHARPLLERGAAVLEQTRGAGHSWAVRAKRDLARLLYDMAELERARGLLAEALVREEEIFGPTSPSLAPALDQHGEVAAAAGDFATAQRFFARALALRESRHATNAQPVASSLLRLGTLLTDSGDHAEARLRLERARALAIDSLGRNHPLTASIVTQQARLSMATGDIERALAQFHEAHDVRAALLDADHPDHARTRLAMGRALAARGRRSEGLKEIESALESLRATFGSDHPEVAGALRSLGSSLLEDGRAERAAVLFQEARAAHEASLGREHPEVAKDLLGLTAALHHAGQEQAALDAALEADAIGHDHLRAAARGLSQRAALRYALTRPSGLGWAIAIARDLDDAAAARRTCDALVRGRAVVLDELSFAREQESTTDSPAITRARRDLTRLRQQHARLLLRPVAPGEPVSARRLTLEQVRRDKERAEAELKRLAPAVSSRASEGLDAIVRRLPARSAMLSYVRYRDPRDGIERYAAFVVQPDASTALHSLGAADELDRAVASWHREAAREPSPVHSLARLDHERYRDAGERLRRLVWDPVAPALGEADTLFVVADGSLHLVNLAVLPVGPSDFLIDSPVRIHHLSTERDILRSAERRPADRSLLVAGAPDLGLPAPRDEWVADRRGADCESVRHGRWPALPGAEQEARALASLWAGTFDDGTVRFLSGPDATEDAVKRLAPSAGVVHLATHGFFLDASCLAGARDGVENNEPLVRSGLVLATTPAVGDEAAGDAGDGLLTAEEIADLNLRNVRLVVLSACLTGVGEIQVGEGVLGLRRAFEIAGADSLVLSLWRIDDDTTTAWMAELYERIVSAHSTVDAVFGATRSILATRREDGLSTHPFYWGGFVATGDGSRPVAASGSTRSTTIGISDRQPEPSTRSR